MKLIVAKSAGFCFGVKRATKMAFEAAGTYHQICSLGPIIHSPQLVQKLAERGVEVVHTVDDVPDGAVIVRSHGITAGELEGLLQRELKIVDATCPFVTKAQKHAALLGREGYAVVIVGEAEHPEVQGIISYVGTGDSFVVASRAEAEALPRCSRIGIVAQTTQSFSNLQEIASACLSRCHELRVFNTICDATSVRQREAGELARTCDLVIVVGGYNSANTTRLAQLCQALQPNTRHIETAAEIDPDWFVGVQKLGITAGASTPPRKTGKPRKENRFCLSNALC